MSVKLLIVAAVVAVVLVLAAVGAAGIGIVQAINWFYQERR